MNFFEQQDHARKRTRELVILFSISVLLILVSVNVAAYLIASGVGFYVHGRHDLFDERPVEQPQAQGPNAEFFIVVSGITLLIIFGGNAYKAMALSGGGPSVAELLGGRPLMPNAGRNDETMLQNVVEEMAIASGVPVPRVYLLDREDGINAFAAGFGPNDTIIGVTRGALTKLHRDELQGVIAHEFSHIL